MAITYHAGRRIQGTSTDFGTDGAGIPAVTGGWKELGRTTLGSAGDTIDVASLADKRYYMILSDLQATGLIQSTDFRVNADSGSNYAYRISSNGGTDATGVSRVGLINGVTQTSTPQFAIAYMSNLSTKEKLLLGHGVGQDTAGAGTAPLRRENSCKWAETTNPIDQLTHNNTGSGSYNTGSELVVLGWDPADTHGTNFWEELASVNASGSSPTLDSGTITAKKYLWVQCFTDPASSTTPQWRVNSDSGSNYSERLSSDGGADGTNVNGSVMNIGNTTATPSFSNTFIINNSANEKLFINNWVGGNTAGAGTAPMRREGTGKWITTGSQITSLQCILAASVNHTTNSTMKVWGSD